MQEGTLLHFPFSFLEELNGLECNLIVTGAAAPPKGGMGGMGAFPPIMAFVPYLPLQFAPVQRYIAYRNNAHAQYFPPNICLRPICPTPFEILVSATTMKSPLATVLGQYT